MTPFPQQQHAAPFKRRASARALARRTTQDDPATRRAAPLVDDPDAGEWWEEDEREERTRRVPTSARYTPLEARALVPVSPPQDQYARRVRRTKHPLFYLGLGVLSAVGLLTLLLGPVGSWWQTWSDDRTYGYPRTFQIDAVVGQDDSPRHPSHFLALNLHGELIVIELPGGDPGKGREFVITTLSGPGADLVPVTLSVADVNQDGKPDLLVQFAGQTVVYLNAQGTFRPARPGEVPPQE
jgi:hypothetical protein